MSDEKEIADRLLKIAASTSSESTQEEQDFSSLMAATRECFRRNNVTSSPRRGRKRKATFKRKMILMKLAHADFFPSNTELQFLKKRGLGLTEEPLEIARNASFDEIKADIISIFHPHIQNLLRMCGFQLGKVGSKKKITLIKDIQNGEDLENKLLQSKIVILPLNDFPNDLPLIEEDDPFASETSQNNVIKSSIHTPQEDNDSDYLESEQISLNNFSPVLQRTTITRPSRSTTMQFQTIENYDCDEDEDEEEEEEEEDDQLSTEQDTNNVEKCVIFPALPEDAETITIEISRSHCFYDLMNTYMDEQILTKKLQVSFLGEIGLDGGGLTKELFNIFFIKCETIFFRGEDCLVPYLELSKLNELDKFVIIGRILQHMLLLTNNVPAKLSRITLMLIAKPERDINFDILLQELLRYVNPYLRKILKKALKNFTSLTVKENETLQDFFQANRFFARPSSELLSQQLKIIATKVLIEKPRKLIAKIRQGVSPEKCASFWNNCDFDVLLDF